MEEDVDRQNENSKNAFALNDRPLKNISFPMFRITYVTNKRPLPLFTRKHVLN